MNSDGPFLLVLVFATGGIPLLLAWPLIRWYRRPHHSPWPVRLICWPLAALGAFGCIGLAIQEIGERRVGLGTGVVTFGFLPLLWRWGRAAITYLRHRAAD